ncbi:phosphate ABC transporter permease PstA [Thiofilum flexile]|uniref:phosphate ABC transporter permease PstA n=1 Tax=Thiofilum flexile TaxID=125627 RepID=UPI000381D569|nr:phosphate ABC transporter permease PstA [Thiofilum flexile]
MTNLTPPATSATTEKVKLGLQKRYSREKRFRWYGIISIVVSLFFLIVLLADITYKALPAFTHHYIQLDIDFNAEKLGISAQSTPEQLRRADYSILVNDALIKQFPNVTGRQEKRALKNIVSSNAPYRLQAMVLENPSLLGTKQAIWFLSNDDSDIYYKDGNERLKPYETQWLDTLKAEGRVDNRFNSTLFTNGDSREPEQAGILSALVGSFFTIALTLSLSFPIGLAAAIYLEEFSPKNNFWVDLIEVNINNLAAVPSIVFGLLGLAVFIQFFGVPRSTPLVGSLVLTLITLPTIIIASRAAIKSVPPSIREAALGLGASKVQTVFHHVVPLAMPGVLTGTIIGMAHALGETAPLLMIGMVAFIIDVPSNLTDPAAVLPVQIYLWADSPERAFVAKTSAAILILLVFLVCMNLLAVILRKRFERRW